MVAGHYSQTVKGIQTRDSPSFSPSSFLYINTFLGFQGDVDTLCTPTGFLGKGFEGSANKRVL